ncbi:Wzz/FepE/Etk N-terminal domain-containing protein [Nocardioides taihuensis]|uniref:Wzz/FepE/Etk N-terminal domain-containing protein n=1 Tax=Nocardioides taihuensis TaxID=1835606 RepID=A0ABW0BL65_9ACTN
MAEPTAAHARELGDYLLIARRRWRWIVGGAAVGLALALVYLQFAQLTYASTAKVSVAALPSDNPAEGARTNDAINLDTEAQLVKSDDVVSNAAQDLESTEGLRRLASRVTVTVPANTTVLNITFRAPTAVAAQTGAQAFAQAYLANREQEALLQLQKEETRLQGEIDTLTKKITDLGAGIQQLTGPGQKVDRAFLIAQRTALNSQLEQYQADLAPVKDATVYPGYISNDATRPSAPVDPNPLLVLPSGLMAGLLAGVVLAGIRERRDKRIHSAVDIERIFGLKPLARMPWGDGSLDDPAGVRLDAEVRAVYHSLRANGPAATESTVVVAPEAVLAGERLAFSLAVAGSRAGASAVYLTRPGHLTAADRSVAAGTRGLLSLPDYESIDTVVAGEVHASALAKRLRGLRSKHDFLVLGLPNDDPVVDLPLLGRQVDVAVVLVALGRTLRGSVESVLTSITKSGIENVAVVVLEKPHRRAFHRTQRLNVITADSEPAPGEVDSGDSDLGIDRFAPEPGDAPGPIRRPAGPGGTPHRAGDQPGSHANGTTNGVHRNGTPVNGGAPLAAGDGEIRPVDRPAGGEARP